MKKFLLILTCMLACLPFARAASIDLPFSNHSFCNSFKQEDTLVSILFADSNGVTNLTGVNNQSGIILVGSDGTEIASTSAEISTLKYNNFASGPCVKATFSYIPAGTYTFKVLAGALQIGNDTNNAFGPSSNNFELTEAGTPGTITPTPASIDLPFTYNSMFRTFQQNENAVSIVFSDGNTFQQLSGVNNVNGIILVAADGTEIASTSAEISTLKVGFPTGPCVKATFSYIPAGTYTFKVLAGALQIGDNTNNAFGPSSDSFDLTEAGTPPTPAQTEVALAYNANGNFKAQEDKVLKVAYYLSDGSPLTTANLTSVLDASKISLVKEGTTDGIAEIESAEIVDWKIMGAVDFKALQLTIKGCETGTYVLKLEAGAIALGENEINAEIAVNIPMQACGDFVKKTSLYWPATNPLIESVTGADAGILFRMAFATTETPTNAADYAQITTIDTETATPQIVVKNEADEIINVSRFYKGYSYDPMKVGDEIEVTPAIIRFSEHLNNGTYTITIPAGIIDMNGTVNDEFVGQFIYAGEKKKLATPTVDKEAGEYPSGTVVTITAPEGGYVAYAFATTQPSKEESIGYFQSDKQVYEYTLEQSGFLFVKSYSPDALDSDVVEVAYTVATPKPETVDLTFTYHSFMESFQQDGTSISIVFSDGNAFQQLSGVNNVNGIILVAADGTEITSTSAEISTLQVNSFASGPCVKATYDKIPAGTYTFKILANALQIGNATNNAFASTNSFQLNAAPAAKNIALYWPANNPLIETVTGEDEGILFKLAFATTENPTSAADYVNITAIDSTAAIAQVTVKNVAGETIAIEQFSKGDASTSMTVGDNVTVIPALLRFNTALENGTYTITIPADIINMSSTSNDEFVGTFTYEAKVIIEKLDAPTFSLPAGEYAKDTKLTITSPEGSIVAYKVVNANSNQDGDFIEAESNVVTITLTEDCTVTAYSKDEAGSQNYDAFSEIVSVDYTILTSGINGIAAELEDAEVFTINGIRVANTENLANGLYIVVKNGKASKVVVK